MCLQGHAVIKMYTQIGSLAFAALLGAKRAVELLPQAAAPKGFITQTMLTLVAGAMLTRFVADQNQDYGLGDGIALLICSGMASGAGPLMRHQSCSPSAASVHAACSCGNETCWHSCSVRDYLFAAAGPSGRGVRAAVGAGRRCAGLPRAGVRVSVCDADREAAAPHLLQTPRTGAFWLCSCSACCMGTAARKGKLSCP